MSSKLPEDQWRAYVRGELDKGEARFKGLERRAEKIEAQVAENTQLTRQAVDVSVSTERKVDQMRIEVQPVTDAVKTMESGIRAMGRIGDAGVKIGKGVAVIGAICLGVKLFFGGATWAEIYAAFLRAIGR